MNLGKRETEREKVLEVECDKTMHGNVSKFITAHGHKFSMYSQSSPRAKHGENKGVFQKEDIEEK